MSTLALIMGSYSILATGQTLCQVCYVSYFCHESILGKFRIDISFRCSFLVKSVPSCGDTNSMYDLKSLLQCPQACPLFPDNWARAENSLKQNRKVFEKLEETTC